MLIAQITNKIGNNAKKYRKSMFYDIFLAVPDPNLGYNHELIRSRTATDWHSILINSSIECLRYESSRVCTHPTISLSGNVDRHGFDTSFVVDRCFGENRHEIALAHEVEQYVGVVQFYPCFKVEFVAFEYLVEHITRLKPFGG